MAESVLYPPVDLPKPVAERIWIVDSGPIRPLGLTLPVRMTIIQLADGSLLLHSPTRFDAGLKKGIERLGPIAHLVAPSSGHWMFVKDWQSHLREVVTWAAPGLRKRAQVQRSGVKLNRDLGSNAPEAWSDEIDHVIIPGIGGFAEVAFFHRTTRTLVLTDLVQNLEPEKLPILTRAAARLAGVTTPCGKAPVYLRAIVKMQGTRARSAAEQLLAFQPERVIFAHGRWFQREGTARLRESLAWLL